MDELTIGDISDESKGEEKMKIPQIKMEGGPTKRQITKQQSESKSPEGSAMLE